jgi:hypothetical protein
VISFPHGDIGFLPALARRDGRAIRLVFRRLRDTEPLLLALDVVLKRFQ